MKACQACITHPILSVSLSTWDEARIPLRSGIEQEEIGYQHCLSGAAMPRSPSDSGLKLSDGGGRPWVGAECIMMSEA